MLSGELKNCYGIKELKIKNVNYSDCNKAIVYAPNGVAKTSLANTFEDIAKGKTTTDRIFKDEKTAYSINYYSSKYDINTLSSKDNIYVVHSFKDKISFSKESISTLLADEETRNSYENLISQFNQEIAEFKQLFSESSGVKVNELELFFKEVFKLDLKNDWNDIFKNLNEIVNKDSTLDFLKNIKYSDIINEKTIDLLKNKDFLKIISEYINKLNELISDNELLCQTFNDDNVENLTKTLKENNLFSNGHKIILKNNKEIVDFKQWETEVKHELNKIYTNKEFININKKLLKNANTKELKKVLKENKDIISLLKDINKLKIQFINSYINSFEKDFKFYYDKIMLYSDDIKKIYETAEVQAERWNSVVNEFNARFKVPFKVKITNKANYLLKDEAPNLVFEYKRILEHQIEQKIEINKDELLGYLSMGEKRAMYLLHILFDLEIIKEKSKIAGSLKYLIIVDDIADSFDYKNKYAIIEYLLEISKNTNIDMLILTHNFDFYRTVISRLNIMRDNCFIIQKAEYEKLEMRQFPYLKDYFANCIVDVIKKAQFKTDDSKVKLIASIPFYRNISEYILPKENFENLTTLLHIKNNTKTLKLSDVYNLIPDVLISNKASVCDIDNDDLYINTLKNLALKIANDTGENIILENKILLSIAIRIGLELYLETILTNNGIDTSCEKDQTRNWSEKAKPFLKDEINKLIESVNLMTPESIHINTFMYEPIVDMSDWALKELFLKINELL